MPTLKVLDLSGSPQLRKLPTSLLGLVSLQYIDLSWTGIRELPIEFKSLVKLKHLYLSYMNELDIVPPQVISSLLMLQRLVMHCSGSGGGSGIGSRDSDSEGNIDEGNTVLFGGNELLLDELECLNHLQYLSLTVQTELALQKLLSLQKFVSFTFGLSIRGFKGASISLQMSSLQKKMERLEILEIVNCEICDDIEELSRDGIRWEERERGAFPHKNNNHPLQKSIIDGSKSFLNLREVDIDGCKVLKDVTWLIWVPNLQRLEIWSCDAMEEIIKDDIIDRDLGKLSVFARLQTLRLIHLPELKSIYTHPLPFPSMTYFEVGECPKLKKFPLDCNSGGKGSQLDILCRNEWVDNLEWENEETRTAFWPLFRCNKKIEEKVDVS